MFVHELRVWQLLLRVVTEIAQSSDTVTDEVFVVGYRREENKSRINNKTPWSNSLF
jgi:hypothetical protein